ncbi:A/G-specific adenine glycosylase [Azospirillaceae bacterium]
MTLSLLAFSSFLFFEHSSKGAGAVKISEQNIPTASPTQLLSWYDRCGRDLPWRSASGSRNDPYRVWLSEVMLQQTTVAATIPYYHNFLTRWPNLRAFASASESEILSAWAGLGYYARARNMHRCAKILVEQFDARFPESEEDLRTLPGVGVYTAAAIMAIAFQRPANVVDGNVERVMARIYAFEEPLPDGGANLRKLAGKHASDSAAIARPGDYAQALMDLGATICTPRRPQCLLCPWRESCLGFALKIAETLPRRAQKPERPTRCGRAYWLSAPNGTILLFRRPARGLLGGMIGLPSSAWRSSLGGDALPDIPPEPVGFEAAAWMVAWRSLSGVVRHSFTHFHLELTGCVGHLSTVAGLQQVTQNFPDGVWISPEEIDDQGLPTLMRKAVAHAHKKTNASRG